MDDYIMEILQMQEEPFTQQSPEKIKKVLTWDAAKKYAVGGINGVVAELMEEGGGWTEKADYEMAAGNAADTEERKQKVLTRVLESMEQVVLGAVGPERQAAAPPWRKGTSDKAATLWTGSIGTQRQAEMGPEALSMFFQRDARRYS